MIRELKQEIEQLQAVGLVREAHAALRLENGQVEIRGKRVVDFTSWDFLNLAFDPRLKRSAQKVIEAVGVGSSSPRLSSGSSEAHAHCEHRIAGFLGAQSSLLFSSKNQALLTLFTSSLSERDVVLIDELSQSPASDAAYLVNAQTAMFQSEDPSSLEAELDKTRAARRRILYVETVSSLTGKQIDLPRVLSIAKKFNADIVLDESFAVASIGLRGAGVSDGILSCDAVACTVLDLSLGLSCYGAALAGTSELIGYLLSRSRTFSYESALPASIAASVDTALDIVELQPLKREGLLLLASRLHSGLSELGMSPEAFSRTPIVSINFAKRSLAAEFAASVFQRGFLVDVVPRGTQFSDSAVVRLIIRSPHSEKHVDQFLQAVADIKARLPKA